LPAYDSAASPVSRWRGFAAFERRDFAATIEALAPLAGQNKRIGGSRAQHDLIEFTLLKAYLGTRRLEAGKRLLSGRPPVLPAFRSRGSQRSSDRRRRCVNASRGRLKMRSQAAALKAVLDEPRLQVMPGCGDGMRTGIEACAGKPALVVTSPADKHFMPGDAELERIGIRIVVRPQDILAASVRAMRDALAGLKGGFKPPMVSPAGLATVIRIAEYLSQDSRWPAERGLSVLSRAAVSGRWWRRARSRRSGGGV
jgi:hypothetical protein